MIILLLPNPGSLAKFLFWLLLVLNSGWSCKSSDSFCPSASRRSLSWNWFGLPWRLPVKAHPEPGCTRSSLVVIPVLKSRPARGPYLEPRPSSMKPEASSPVHPSGWSFACLSWSGSLNNGSAVS